MARLNRIPKSVYTHEGGKAKHINAELELTRAVMACLLWEKNFYESGQSVVDRIRDLVPKVSPEKVANLAILARHEMNLRHVPLLLAQIMVTLPSHRPYVADVLEKIIHRPDELSEFMALYWLKGRCPVAAQVKKGLARAFVKFNEYQLAKWDKNYAIKLRDVMFICHPKPKNIEQAAVWKRLAEGELQTPDTWEVGLSKVGSDKKEVWARLLKENKLGGMALLRNLRNMEMVGVDTNLVRNSIVNIKSNYILPYRYIAAAKYAPQMEDVLETAMFRSLEEHKKLPGRTTLLVDVSGSMFVRLSDKSDLQRMDAACGLAMLLREISEDIDIFTFSTNLVRVPPRRGFALRDAILTSQEHSSTYLGAAVRNIYATKGKKERFVGSWSGHLTFTGQGLSPDRLIVITDEQAHDSCPDPKGIGYMLNVASYQHGVGYGAWLHIDGFSESCVRWIQETEAFANKM